MINELIINNADAFSTYGASMAEGFITALLTPPPLKSFIKDSSRASHGSSYIVSTPRLDEREVSLGFYIQGDTPQQFTERYALFLSMLQYGNVTISYLGSPCSYKLIYTGKNVTLTLNRAGTFALFNAKFIEPNPSDRPDIIVASATPRTTTTPRTAPRSGTNNSQVPNDDDSDDPPADDSALSYLFASLAMPPTPNYDGIFYFDEYGNPLPYFH